MRQIITIKIMPDFLYDSLRGLKRKMKGVEIQRFPIIDASRYEVVNEIKPELWDEQIIAETYKLCEGRRTKYYHPKQNIVKISNAVVINGSDIVLTSDGALWDKFFMPTFSKQKLCDRNLFRLRDGDIEGRRYPNKEFMKGEVLSLLGTSAYAWAHFIEQNLPKLCYAKEAGLLNNPITILTPVHNWKGNVDPNITEVIQLITNGCPDVIIKQAKINMEYVCEHLYWMPSGAQTMDGSYFHSTFDTIIPQRLKNALKDHVITPLCKNVKSEKKRKLFLSRSGLQRGLINNEEIESFFREKGYKIINCSTLSLKEKAELFSSAVEIAGPNGSAWSNCMFCQGAKGMMFSNLARADEIYQFTMASIGNVSILNITGQDYPPLGTSSSYYVPIEKLKEAYDYWILKE